MINRTINPNKNLKLNTTNIDRSNLLPQFHKMDNGNNIVCFNSQSVDIVKIDFVFEAGKAYQSHMLSAMIANKLITEGTSKHTAKEIAEILDYRGIYIDKNIDSTTATISVLMVKKYVLEILPLLHEILTDAVFPENEFQITINKSKQRFLNEMMKTNYVARRTFYQNIFGKEHIYGSFASEKDFDKLTVDNVREFYNKHYHIDNCKIFVSGNIDDNILVTINQLFGQKKTSSLLSPIVPKPVFLLPTQVYIPKADAVQSTIRIGKVLDTTWDTTDFTEIMLANTILGGYFGSKLTANIREEKGYCYSIYSMVQAFRGANVFFITTEVGKDVTHDAVKEIYNELSNMSTQPVSNEELEVVKGYLIGDFIRSIDGVFEIADRYKTMVTSHSSEVFTDNYLKTIDSITPEKICQISAKYLDKDSMTQIIVG